MATLIDRNYSMIIDGRLNMGAKTILDDNITYPAMFYPLGKNDPDAIPRQGPYVDLPRYQGLSVVNKVADRPFNCLSPILYPLNIHLNYHYRQTETGAALVLGSLYFSQLMGDHLMNLNFHELSPLDGSIMKTNLVSSSYRDTNHIELNPRQLQRIMGSKALLPLEYPLFLNAEDNSFGYTLAMKLMSRLMITESARVLKDPPWEARERLLNGLHKGDRQWDEALATVMGFSGDLLSMPEKGQLVWVD